MSATVTAYRPIVQLDFPSSYMRNSLQGLLLRDDTLAAAMDRATSHRLEMNVLALPALGDVIEGISAVARSADASIVFLSSTLLADLQLRDTDAVSTAIAHFMHADPARGNATNTNTIEQFLLASPCDIAVLFDHGPGLTYITHALIPIHIGEHCTAAIRFACSLAANGVSVTALVLPGPHKHNLPSEFRIQTIETSAAVSADAAGEPRNDPPSPAELICLELTNGIGYQLLIVSDASPIITAHKDHWEILTQFSALAHVLAVHSAPTVGAVESSSELSVDSDLACPSFALSALLGPRPMTVRT
jgi:hypothetical protein